MARSTFASQNVHKTAFPDHFFKFRCRNIARGCGAKHICKPNAQNTTVTASDQFWKFRCRNIARGCGAKRIYKSKCTAPHSRTTFSSLDVETLHAAVVRRAFASQNAQSTAFPDHFFKFRCRNIARGCGAKSICKSNCTKHRSFGPILEVLMSKNGTRLWRDICKSKCAKHRSFGSFDVEGVRYSFQVKMYKTPQLRSNFWSFDVQK